LLSPLALPSPLCTYAVPRSPVLFDYPFCDSIRSMQQEIGRRATKNALKSAPLGRIGRFGALGSTALAIILSLVVLGAKNTNSKAIGVILLLLSLLMCLFEIFSLQPFADLDTVTFGAFEKVPGYVALHNTLQVYAVRAAVYLLLAVFGFINTATIFPGVLLLFVAIIFAVAHVQGHSGELAAKVAADEQPAPTGRADEEAGRSQPSMAMDDVLARQGRTGSTAGADPDDDVYVA